MKMIIEDAKKSKSLEAKFKRCKAAVQKQGKSESSSFAICSPLNPKLSKSRRGKLSASRRRTTHK